MTDNKPNSQNNKQQKIILLLLIGIVVIIASFHVFYFFTSNKSTPQTAITRHNIEQQIMLRKMQEELRILWQEKNLGSNNFAVLEINHLLRMADIILESEADTITALELLQIAKQYASSMGLMQTYHAIVKDIAKLQNTLIIDKENLVARLDELNQRIANLQPLPQQQPAETVFAKPAPIKTTATNSIVNWIPVNTVLTNLKKALQQIIIVRPTKIEPLPSVDQYANLKINLQSKILQAEWAVLHRQNTIFQSSLIQIIYWIDRYFSLNNAETQNILQVLGKLKNININPTIPSLTASAVMAQELLTLKPEISSQKNQPAIESEPQIPPPAAALVPREDHGTRNEKPATPKTAEPAPQTAKLL